ncbi:DedA family protein [Aminobacter aganoensis]|uniref:Membrane protein DedA with SNARE-associated domain n=1 Tax=Aminobacter aganoensis TaxID=83264 RepID=A0A7X0KKQ4_9HYPH|nr:MULTISPECIES: DedA family protein [Aminobacter]KQU64205.1 alkaline phosphatase [Aminobacter sp. DSM 101952]MBB6354255.1 membrane protein DedA with SNARE-associated domain [Aminobacter aganoensis]
MIPSILGFGLFGAACLAFTEKISPVPPSHVLLLFLGMTAAPDMQTLVALMFATMIGSTLGSMIWYAGGNWLGPDRADAFVRRFGKFVFLKHATYHRLTQAYRRNNFRASLVAQLVPVARTYLALEAGVLRLSFLPFALATLCGALIWNSAFLVGGYLMRDGDHDPVTIGFRIVAIVVAAEIVFLLALRHSTRRPAEDRPPGEPPR